MSVLKKWKENQYIFFFIKEGRRWKMVIIILLLYSGTESGFEVREGGYAVGCVQQL